MPIPEYKPRPNQGAIVQGNADKLHSVCSWQPVEIKFSAIERWLFLGVVAATLLVIVSHPVLLGDGDENSLYLRLVLWVGLSGLGGYRLWAQRPLSLHYHSPNQFKTINNIPYEFELVWALMPRLMVVRYRSLGDRWRQRMIWPDSANAEALRILRASFTSSR